VTPKPPVVISEEVCVCMVLHAVPLSNPTDKRHAS
jgi:hypothetical protein